MLLLLVGCTLFDTSATEARIRFLTDGDGDGYSLDEDDCNDYDPAAYPSAAEVCDGKDNDCDNAIDEDGGATVWCRDEDGDGHGDPDTLSNDCSTPTTAVVVCDDCDDTLAAVSPAAIETCNGVDDDCDGVIDPPTATDVTTWYQDSDEDGYGDPVRTTAACEAPAGYTDHGEDCDDREATVNPAQPEVCNDGLDNDCDGTANGCGLLGEHLVQPGQGEEGYYGPNDADHGVGFALGVYLLDLQGDGLSKPVVVSNSYPDSGSYGSGSVTFYGSVPYGASGWDDSSHIYYGHPGQFVGIGANPPFLYDTNLDGIDELLIPAPGAATEFPAAGCIIAIEDIPPSPTVASPEDSLICGPEDYAFFGWTIRAADEMYEGEPALVVGAPDSNHFATEGGVAYIVDPGAISTASPIAEISPATPGMNVGSQLAPVTDLDGDGIADLLFGVQPITPGNGGVWVLHGPLFGDVSLENADSYLTDPNEFDLGYNIDVIDDLLGDGLPAIVASAAREEEAELYVIPGSTVGAKTPEEAASIRFTTNGGSYGNPTHGDLNGDGHQDLLAGFPLWRDAERDLEGGAIFLLSGPLSSAGATAIDDIADSSWLGNLAGANVGPGIASADANNDGFDDLFFSGISPTDIDYPDYSAWFWYGQGI